MLSPRILTTLFCQNLLHTREEPLYTHLALHIPLKTIAGFYRTTFDNRHTTISFCLGPRRCVGYSVEELDGEDWDGPRLLTWKTLSEYIPYMPEPLPESAPWGVILKCFATVDLILDGQVHTSSGRAAAETAPYMDLYRVFD